ncbi:MAG: hypothetical protein AB7U79_01740 [Candidatus Izemoplasmatales bacterium]
MNDEGTRLFKQTTDTIHQSELKVELINSLFYIPLVLFLFYLVDIGYTVFNIAFVIILSFIYGFLKEGLFHKRTKKMLNNQYEYLQSKYQEIDLCIPVLDKRGRRLVLKPSSLVLSKGVLFLEAYKQAFNAGVPEESIRVDYGDDFFITGFIDTDSPLYTTYQATLANTNYRFITVKDEFVSSTLEKFYKQERN